MMTALALESIEKRFDGGVRALCGIDLTVAAHEFLAIVGASGCGKTTLLHIIAGIERADAGVIRFDGVDVTAQTPKQRNVGLVMQTGALYPHLTVAGNLAFGLKLQGLPRAEIEQRIGSTAAMLEIDQLLERRPSTLSGGQRQRVALARALVRRPRVLLLDEPLSALDAELRFELRGRLAELHRNEPLTTLLVTHDPAEALALGDRVAVLHEGRLLQLDTPQRVHDEPAHPGVARLVGGRPMNLLAGRLDESGVFAGQGLRLPLPQAADGTITGSFRGADVHLGLRPEDITLQASSGQGSRMAASGEAAANGDAPTNGDAGARLGDSKSGGATGACDAAAPASAPAAPIRAEFTGVVRHIEVGGASHDVHLLVGDGAALVARVPGPVATAVGAELVVCLDLSRAHVFPADAGGSEGRGRSR